MMARMPGAVWLGEHSPGRRIVRYDAVCVHTIVGYAPAHAAHFSVKADGTILQSRDTVFQSGANLEGNHRIIAIENEDHGSAFGSWNIHDGHAVPGFTEEQREANAKIIAWAHETHGIPIKACPNSRPSSRGVAYHRQGIKGNWSGYEYGGWVSGGEIWTTSPGKVCPGDRRIKETLEIIIPRAREIAGGDDMSEKAERMIEAMFQVLCNSNSAMMKSPAGNEVSVRYGVQEAPRYVNRYRATWWGNWEERWPALEQNFPDGLTMEALAVHSYGYSRLANEKLDKVIELNRIQIDAYEGQDTKAILRRVDKRAKETQALIEPLQDDLNVITDLIQQHHNGELDAEQVVTKIGERLTPPQGEGTDENPEA